VCSAKVTDIVDLTTIELLQRDVKFANNGTFCIPVSAIVTEMQVLCSQFEVNVL